MDDDEHGNFIIRSSESSHVMTLTAFVKTELMDRALEWPSDLQIVDRTTAECLWHNFGLSAPFGPWRNDAMRAPPQSLAVWILYLLVADDASSNRRVSAHAESLAVTERCRVLFACFKCMVHILHRTVVPMLRTFNVIGQVYRVCNVASVGSFWSLLVGSAGNANNVFPVHNYEADPHHRVVAEQVLRICYLNNLPDEYHSANKLAFVEEVLHSLPGDWTSARILWRCCGLSSNKTFPFFIVVTWGAATFLFACKTNQHETPSKTVEKEDVFVWNQGRGCTNDDQCKRQAGIGVKALLSKLLYKSKLGRPSASRWWKAAPQMRRSGLGVCCHKQWQRAWSLPNMPGHRGVNEDDWHAEHAWRQRTSGDFLRHPDTPTTLLVTLQGMGSPHSVMAWIMHHDARVLNSRVRQSFPSNRGHAAGGRSDRVSVVLDFISVPSSPVWKALGSVSSLLLEGRRETNWAAAFAFARSSEATTITLIWRCVLPANAKLWVAIALATGRCPLILVFLLSSRAVEREFAIATWLKLRRCCCPRGFQALHDATRRRVQVTSQWVASLLREFCSQFDFSNFDQEILHAKTRAQIEAAGGAQASFDTISHLHLARELGAVHRQHVLGQPAQRKLGRPRAKRKKPKDKRFHAFNAFVSVRKPLVEKTKRGKEIKSGRHLEALAKEWAGLDAEGRQPYERIAVAKKSKLLEELNNNDPEAKPVATQPSHAQGPWGIGLGELPLSPELSATPPLDEEFTNQVEQWQAQLRAGIAHDPSSLPRNISYDDVCSPFMCVHHEDYDEVSRLRGAFHSRLRGIQETTCFIIMGEGPSDYVAEVYMIAHRLGNPVEIVCLRLEVSPPTLQADVEAHVNFPWRFSFCRTGSVWGFNLPETVMAFCVDWEVCFGLVKKAWISGGGGGSSSDSVGIQQH